MGNYNEIRQEAEDWLNDKFALDSKLGINAYKHNGIIQLVDNMLMMILPGNDDWISVDESGFPDEIGWYTVIVKLEHGRISGLRKFDMDYILDETDFMVGDKELVTHYMSSPLPSFPDEKN